MTIIKGNVARISELYEFEREDGTKKTTVYMTVIRNHDRKGENGERIPAGRTVYDVSFSAGTMAARVRDSFRPGDPVLIEADNERTSLNTNRPDGEAEPVVKARGLDIGLSCRYRTLSAALESAAA
ncbi:hypothetical protein [Nocardia abscessus]|uniref:hypothetical protein n=1 Tax=Nocardia abscessus TaxID=120957 RepID=UPI0024590067|nr:hypothetical protein [Nocardia abscessus]